MARTNKTKLGKTGQVKTGQGNRWKDRKGMERKGEEKTIREFQNLAFSRPSVPKVPQKTLRYCAISLRFPQNHRELERSRISEK